MNDSVKETTDAEKRKGDRIEEEMLLAESKYRASAELGDPGADERDKAQCEEQPTERERYAIHCRAS